MKRILFSIVLIGGVSLPLLGCGNADAPKKGADLPKKATGVTPDVPPPPPPPK